MGEEFTIYAIASVAVLLAGISKGGFGGGLAFIATPLMATAVAPGQAAAIMLPILILIDQAGMRAYWRRWRWETVWPVLIAAVVGIGLGALAFGALSADLLRLGLGVIAVGFLVFQLAKLRGWAPEVSGRRGLRAAIWGTACGFTSTISHAGGPPITIYLLGERLEKTAYQASAVAIFWTINLMKVGPYAALGVFTRETLTISAALIPAALVGTAIGFWAHKRASERLFFSVLAVLLLLTGLKLIWDGATGLWG